MYRVIKNEMRNERLEFSLDQEQNWFSIILRYFHLLYITSPGIHKLYRDENTRKRTHKNHYMLQLCVTKLF
jgi:hypothetical protein